MSDRGISFGDVIEMIEYKIEREAIERLQGYYKISDEENDKTTKQDKESPKVSDGENEIHKHLETN